MTSPRWSTLVSGVVLTLALAVGGPARAQFFFDGPPCLPYPPVSDFGLGFGPGTDAGIWPPGYGSFAGASYGDLARIGAFPLPGPSSYAWPRTTTSFQPIYSTITLLPGWNGSTHRVRRRR